MRNFAPLLLTLVAALGLSAPASAWCGGKPIDTWREFYSLWGADLSRGEGRPMLFVFGAPWCPYCAETLKIYQSKEWRFDIRFVPKDAVGDLHRSQIADLIIDGGAASVVRVFEQRRADLSKISPAVAKWVTDVQLTTQHALNVRFIDQGGRLDSPTSFYLDRSGVYRFTGMPNLAQIERTIVADGLPTPRRDTRRLITAGPPKARPISGKPFANKDNVRLRVMPHSNGFSAVCFPRGHGFPGHVVELVELDGVQWLAFRGPFRDAPNTTLYGLASDFSGWNVR